ncbi:MAG TPA: hypothetical protein VGS10_00970 [Terracidiphilus sp.]|nr:hypothetical protein [Terracidiphilus sp.]
MRKLAVCISLLFFVPAFVPLVRAQEAAKASNTATGADTAAPAHFYKLEFVLEELDSAGKPVNSRTFSTIVSTGKYQTGTIVTGSKVPLATGTESPKSAPDNVSTQFQYIDVGVKITTRDVHDDGNHLTFNLDTVVSNLGTPAVIAGVSEPVIRNNEWNGDVLIPIGKASTVFKSDSLDNKGSMQLVVTANRVE